MLFHVLPQMAAPFVGAVVLLAVVGFQADDDPGASVATAEEVFHHTAKSNWLTDAENHKKSLFSKLFFYYANKLRTSFLTLHRD